MDSNKLYWMKYSQSVREERATFKDSYPHIVIIVLVISLSIEWIEYYDKKKLKICIRSQVKKEAISIRIIFCWR